MSSRRSPRLLRDPQTWTAPWKVAFELKLTLDYDMLEYACHEGNLGLPNALSAARATEHESR